MALNLLRVLKNRSLVKYCYMYLILGSCHGNYAAAAAEYSAHYVH
jgi:hypothetical protein